MVETLSHHLLHLSSRSNLREVPAMNNRTSVTSVKPSQPHRHKEARAVISRLRHLHKTMLEDNRVETLRHHSSKAVNKEVRVVSNPHRLLRRTTMEDKEDSRVATLLHLSSRSSLREVPAMDNRNSVRSVRRSLPHHHKEARAETSHRRRLHRAMLEDNKVETHRRPSSKAVNKEVKVARSLHHHLPRTTMEDSRVETLLHLKAATRAEAILLLHHHHHKATMVDREAMEETHLPLLLLPHRVVTEVREETAVTRLLHHHLLQEAMVDKEATVAIHLLLLPHHHHHHPLPQFFLNLP